MLAKGLKLSVHRGLTVVWAAQHSKVERRHEQFLIWKSLQLQEKSTHDICAQGGRAWAEVLTMAVKRCAGPSGTGHTSTSTSYGLRNGEFSPISSFASVTAFSQAILTDGAEKLHSLTIVLWVSSDIIPCPQPYSYGEYPRSIVSSKRGFPICMDNA